MRIISSKIIGEISGEYGILLKEEMVKLPNGKLRKFGFAHCTYEVVYVLAMTTKKEIALIRQYRHPLRKFIWEIPAGKPKKGESLKACAIRELEEEIGYTAQKISYIFSFYLSPGFTDQLGHLFWASELIKSEQRLDVSEFIEVKFLKPEKALKMMWQDKNWNIAALLGIILAILYEMDANSCL